MYFDASERIALKSGFSHSTIEKLDEFLAQAHVRRFESRQAQEKTNLIEDLSPILREYVRERVLKIETVYLCPVHEMELRATPQRIGKCDDCGKGYPLEDCPSKQIFVRIAEPDVEPVANIEKLGASRVNKVVWWKQPSNVLAISALIVSVFGVIFAFIAIVPILCPVSDSTFSNSIHIDATVESTILTEDSIPELTIEPKDRSLSFQTLLPSAEVTAEQTAELTDVP